MPPSYRQANSSGYAVKRGEVNGYAAVVSDGRRQLLALRRGGRRLLEALARVPLTGDAELDALCQPVPAPGRRVAAFNPIHPDTANLFAAVLSGDFTVNGFRNRDLQGKLYPAAATDVADAKRRTHRTSRLIAKLRGHGLITRVKNSRLYRLTTKGFKAMWPAVRFRRIDFPTAFRAAQAA
jgi:hypothetical protein